VAGAHRIRSLRGLQYVALCVRAKSDGAPVGRIGARGDVLSIYSQGHGHRAHNCWMDHCAPARVTGSPGTMSAGGRYTPSATLPAPAV
jgi:hypothetical protein